MAEQQHNLEFGVASTSTIGTRKGTKRKQNQQKLKEEELVTPTTSSSNNQSQEQQTKTKKGRKSRKLSGRKSSEPSTSVETVISPLGGAGGTSSSSTLKSNKTNTNTTKTKQEKVIVKPTTKTVQIKSRKTTSSTVSKTTPKKKQQTTSTTKKQNTADLPSTSTSNKKINKVLKKSNTATTTTTSAVSIKKKTNVALVDTKKSNTTNKAVKSDKSSSSTTTSTVSSSDKKKSISNKKLTTTTVEKKSTADKKISTAVVDKKTIATNTTSTSSSNVDKSINVLRKILLRSPSKVSETSASGDSFESNIKASSKNQKPKEEIIPLKKSKYTRSNSTNSSTTKSKENTSSSSGSKSKDKSSAGVKRKYNFRNPSSATAAATTSTSSGASSSNHGNKIDRKNTEEVPSKKAKVVNTLVGLSDKQQKSALRRSTRCKITTGSCASTSRRTSRGGGGTGTHQTSSNTTTGVSGKTAFTEALSGTQEMSDSTNNGDDKHPAQASGSTAASGSGSSTVMAPATSSTSSSTVPPTGMDAEGEDSEVGRLQALLEARGLPPHLFGALGPRVQHLLNKSMGVSSTATKAQQLLVSLQATGDEDQQLQAVVEMCQMLVMGNEDTLTGFPVKQVVPALITLLSMDHNFDMMNNACRALTYMMEALPRSSAVVLDAIPAFLDKLQVIQCMDVAEQSLTALEMLSRRHSKAILQARGVSACLTYIDFFSIVAQRAALAVTANCCNNLHSDEFSLISPSLPNLAKRLTHQDKKSVESICLVFSRLVDSFQNDPEKLREIASEELLTNIQQLLVVSPPLISTGTFITVLRMLTTMCCSCADLALVLLKHNIADTLCYLLTSAPSNKEQIELISRSPQEVYEITCLIGELMPRLPTDGLFSVDSLLMLERAGTVSGTVQDAVQWQWKDDRNIWHSYSPIDSRIIEAAHQAGEDEMSLSTLGREYTLDFHAMQQINEHTGTTRAVTRRVINPVAPLGSSQENLEVTNNNRCVLSSSNGAVLAASFIRSLFSVLYEVYSSSAGPAVRCKCLRALLRMVYYASPELLQEVLKNQVVSSHIACMMASQDLRIVVGALQMAEILMQKLPHVFEIHFTREGVIHQIKQLADPSVQLGASPPKQAPPTPSSTDALLQAGPSSNSFHAALTASFTSNDSLLSSANGNTLSPTDMRMSTFQTSSSGPYQTSDLTSSTSGTGSGGVLREETISTSVSTTLTTGSTSSSTTTAASAKVSSPQIRLSDVLKRKRTTKNRNTASRKTKHESTPSLTSFTNSVVDTSSNTASGSTSASMSMHDFFSKASSSTGGGGHSHVGTRSSSRSKFAGATTNFLAHLNPARWGRSTEQNYHKDSAALPKCPSSSNLSAGNREKARVWVRERASAFLDNHETSKKLKSTDSAHPVMDILSRLTSTISKLGNQCDDSLSALKELRDIVLTSDISPFEVNHSGLVRALLLYLTRVDISEGTDDRYTRIRKFLHVFAKCPLEANVIVDEKECNADSLSALVAKLNGCVSQLEQLPVKVHDLPAGTGSTTALKFFNTHQLKCHLQRHPSCSNLKQWKGGTVKIDPLALVQAIERYLVVRGYGRIRDKDSGESDDDNSEEDIDDTLAAVVISQGSRHKLQFLIGEHILPYNMTVYQAIRQYSPAVHNDPGCENDADSEAPLGSASVWVQSHTIYYRPVVEDNVQDSNKSSSSTSTGVANLSVSRKGKSTSGKSVSKKKGDEIWSDGLVPIVKSPLDMYLADNLPSSVTINDACLPVLNLLRVLNALNRFWGSLYIPVHNAPLINQSNFVNCKICAKASRQLQDPLVIMTGNLPAWLQQIASTCPFLLNFEIRQLLLYASSFDRDRALQRLVDSTPEINNHSDSQERVTPRLDRRKRTVSRQNILKQAESLLSDLAHSKALLEIQYENEVGTGLGPTLEFYALVSKELQKSDLELWHNSSTNDITDNIYVFSKHGLYPIPVSKTTKVSHIVKLKSKFSFLGKLMAKAVMDSRMLDLPLCTTFYKWLLGQESTLNLSDLACIVPEVYQTIARFQPILVEKYQIENNPNLTSEQKEEKINNLALDGCLIEDIGLDFTLPGYAHVELRKDGKDISVTIHNLAQYCKLVVHWYLNEGISRQMESFKEGFECVFPLSQLNVFYPEELENVFCGSGASSWDMKTLIECCRIDHGYTHNSKAIKLLFHVLSCYNSQEQRDFIQFVTGSPRLPVGGFRALSPPLTIVRKTFESELELGADNFLPSVMTCVNYLKLPDYSSVEVMKDKLRLAAQEGQHSFHLS